MKLKFDVCGRTQPDPFIFEDDGRLYLYVTGSEGVEAYSATDLTDGWHYEGVVTAFADGRDFWAPSVIKHEGIYYMYVSCYRSIDGEACNEHMHVARATSPLGPFTDEKRLYHRFSIDSHAVKTDAGLFLWFAQDNLACERVGTRVCIDRLLDPYTPANEVREMIVPTFDEEWFTPQCTPERNWHTIEGAFWFREGEWQYVMYSGGCYQDDTYHIGYAAAKTSETDLTKLDLEKHTKDGHFAPVLIKNEFEEGTGHHSVIKWRGEYYAIYHGRDYAPKDGSGYREERTARACRLHVKDGSITAERYENKL